MGNPENTSALKSLSMGEGFRERSIAKLHYLTQDLPNISHAELAEAACMGGVDWVQLRVKNKPEEEWRKIATEVKAITDKFGAKLIINDNVAIAKEIGAAGVHLGKNDMDPAEARHFLGDAYMIGYTANSAEDLQRLKDLDVDYIGLGPYRFTTTKENLSEVLKPEQFRQILQIQNKIPVVIIGGIVLQDVADILALGAHGVAVSSAINLAKDATAMAEEFVKELEKCKKEKLVRD